MQIKVTWWENPDGTSAQSDDLHTNIRSKEFKATKYFVAGIVAAPYGVWDMDCGDTIVSIFLPSKTLPTLGRIAGRGPSSGPGSGSKGWIKLTGAEIHKQYLSHIMCKDSDSLRMGDVAVSYEDECKYFRPSCGEYKSFVEGLLWFKTHIDSDCEYELTCDCDEKCKNE
jgi:hypothetical protein